MAAAASRPSVWRRLIMTASDWAEAGGNDADDIVVKR
jgi:hypothetical protein